MLSFFKKNYLTIALFAVLIFAFIVATFFDLEIMQSVACLGSGEHSTSNFFCIFFESFGEMPLYAFGSIAFWIIALYFTYEAKRRGYKFYDYILIASMIILAFYINYIGMKALFGYIAKHNNFSDKLSGSLAEVLYIVSGIAFTLLWWLVALKCPKEKLKRLAICSLIVILTIIMSQILMRLIKHFMGRPRYRYLNYTNDFSRYLPWYLRNTDKALTEAQQAFGLGSGEFRSFPSGHTAAATISFAVTFLPLAVDKFKSSFWKVFWWAVAVIYTFTVAFSRVYMGAHFLTDVLAAMIITLTVFLIFKTVFLKNEEPRFAKGKPLSGKNSQ